MRRVVLTLFVILACSRQSGVNADTSVMRMGAPDLAAVRHAIDSSLAVYMDAVLRGDTVAIANTYADDAQLFVGGQKAARGRADIMRLNAGMLSAMKVSKIKIATTDVIVSGEYAIETGTYEVSLQPKNGKAIDDIGKYVAVWKKQPDGSWRMIRDVSNSDKAM